MLGCIRGTIVTRSTRVPVLVGIAVGFTLVAGCTSTSDNPGVTPTESTTVTQAPEVVMKAPGSLLDTMDAAAVWTDSQDALELVWANADIEGDPPLVDDTPVVIVATGESGSCPLLLEDVDVATGQIDLVVTTTSDGKRLGESGATDIACTADYNPVVFVVALGEGAPAPPVTVAFDNWTVSLEAADTVVISDQ